MSEVIRVRIPNPNKHLAVVRRREKQLKSARELAALAMMAGVKKAMIITSIMKETQLTVRDARAVYKQARNRRKGAAK